MAVAIVVGTRAATIRTAAAARVMLGSARAEQDGLLGYVGRMARIGYVR